VARAESTGPSSDITCPSCGATFSGAALGKRRRVQCPKCREVVTLEAKSPTTDLDRLKAELAELQGEVKRLAGLEARVAALEETLGIHFGTPDAEPETVASPTHLRWLHRAETDSPENDRLLDPRREAILQHNLQQSPGKLISIRSAMGDPVARELAERFKAVFERSSWRVDGVEEMPVSMAEHGLALAGGALPTPPDLATAYMAFTAAGFDFVPKLDPSLEPTDAVLIVA